MLKRFITIFILITGWELHIAAQEFVTHGEYFIGNDPGAGYAQSLPAAWNGSLATLVQSTTVSNASGFYRLSVRLKSSNNLWSETRSTIFYVRDESTVTPGEPTIEQVVAAEYFIGNDPGAGNAIAVPLAWDGSMATLVQTAVGPDAVGFYRLNMRYQSSNNIWSETRSIIFYVSDESIVTPGEPTIEQVVAAEYFIGSDPGAGNAIAVPLAWDGNMATLVQTAAGPDAVGFYRLNMRYQSSNNLWSETRSVIFYVSDESTVTPGEPTIEQVVAAEYFIGSDPGAGNAIAVPLAWDGNMATLVQTAVGPNAVGFYRLNMRYRSSNNLWSETRSVIFYVSDESTVNPGEPIIEQVVACEYYFDTDPSPGNGTPLSIEQSSVVDIDALASVNNLSLGAHKFFLRFQSSNGLWSAAEMRPFEVCTISGPVASFNHIQNGNVVFLESMSTGADSLAWSVNGSVFSHSPFATFTSTPGMYPIQLTAVNVCGDSIAIQEVTVNGISNFTPQVGSNLGNTTMTIHGAGFQAGDELYTLTFSDGTSIIPDTVIVSANGATAQATFNLIGTNTGNYALHVEIPGHASYTAIDSFFVSDQVGGSISYAFNVPNVSRPTDWRDYSLVITNNSNLDVEQVPFILAFPDYADVELRFDIIDVGLDPAPELANIPDFITIDSVWNVPYHRKVFLGICPQLTAHSTITYTVRARMNQLGIAAPMAHVFNISSNEIVPVNGFNSDDLSRSLSSDCLTSMVSVGGDLAGFSRALASPFLNCALGTASLAWSAYNDMSFVNSYHESASAISISLNFANTALNCGIAAAGVFVGGAGAVGLAVAAVPILSTIASVGLGINTFSTVVDGTGLINDCIYKPLQNTFDWLVNEGLNDFNNLIFVPNYNYSYPVNVVTSWDPNEIWGIDEYNGYTNEETFTYTIFCENEPTAAIPAVEVNLYDTLDLNFFDPSSFRLNSINLPDTTILLADGISAFATEYTLENGLTLRISAQFNTETGIAHWRFISLDPITLDYPLDLSLGLLPPNVNAPEGEASVSFSINRRADTQDGQQVDNAASIIFDYNEPIYTNVWENELDLIPPVSTMEMAESPTDTIIRLHWSGIDNRSGVGYYKLYVSENGGEFQLIAGGIAADSISLIGSYGVEYGFYVTAVDNVGNMEQKEPIAETTVRPWPINLAIEPFIEQPSCAGVTDGVITLTTFGGDGNYTYLWSTGETTSWIDSLPAGTYSVSIQDGGVLDTTASFSIIAPLELVVAPSITQPICPNETGSIALDINGGTGTYTIDWDGLDSLAVAPGHYLINVFDSNGCSSALDVTMTSIGTSEVSAVITTQPALCFGENGSVMLSSIQGNGTVSTNWNGVNPQALPIGSYAVILTDSLNCTASLSYEISGPSEILVTWETFNTDSAACTGSIELGISGGTPPYDVSWNNPQGATGVSLNNLCEGSYSATVTDANMCTSDFSEINIALSDNENPEQHAQLYITPNPGNGRFLLNIQANAIGTIQWRVLDEQGRLILISSQQHVALGSNSWPIHLDSYPNGNYWIQMQYNDSTLTRSLIKIGQ
jgi:hypothetical protein